MRIAHILAPTDFSTHSLRGLEYAIDFAKSMDARLSLLYVVEPLYLASPADLHGASTNLAMLADEQRRMAQQQLAKLKTDVESRSVETDTVLASGTPSEVIVDTAKKRKADLIIMSTHGRSGVSHLLMGSVAEKVVRGAECPVLTVRRGAAAASVKRPKRKTKSKAK